MRGIDRGVSALGLSVALMAAGCSSDGGNPAEAFDALGVDGTAAEVVAKAILEPDFRTRLGDYADTAIAVQMVPEGYSWADAMCVVDATKAAMGDSYGELRVGTIRSIVWDHPEMREASVACRSEETQARRDNVVEENDISIAAPLPGPDPDLGAIREYYDWLFRSGASRAGLKGDDLACIIDASMAGLDDDTIRLIATNDFSVSFGEMAEAVSGCLDEDEINAAALLAVPALQASAEAAEDEATRVKILQDQWAATTTTTAPQG